jgi:hypothetical protein
MQNMHNIGQKLQHISPYEGCPYTGEAKSPQLQKRTSRTSKKYISSFFSFFVGRFCPPGSGSSGKNQCRSRSGSTTLGERFSDVKLSCSVLRILDVYSGSWIRIFSIPDLGSASKNLSILTKKNGF